MCVCLSLVTALTSLNTATLSHSLALNVFLQVTCFVRLYALFSRTLVTSEFDVVECLHAGSDMSAEAWLTGTTHGSNFGQVPALPTPTNDSCRYQRDLRGYWRQRADERFGDPPPRPLWPHLNVVRLPPQSPGERECVFFFGLSMFVCVLSPPPPPALNDIYFIRLWHDIACLCWKCR